jgi:hypothetical protein
MESRRSQQSRNKKEEQMMLYNLYTMERMASEIQKDRIEEAKRYSKWAKARRAARELSKTLAAR